MNICVSNNFVNFSDLFLHGKGDSVISFLNSDKTINDFLAKTKERNFIAPSASVQTLGVGFQAGSDLYISVDVIDRVNGDFIIPGDLFKLLLKGNEDFIGQTINFSSFDADFQYYREYGLGFSKGIGNNLRIGIKPKFLTGMMAFSMENNSLGLTVNEDYSHTLDADLSAHFSYPFEVYTDSLNRIDDITVDDAYFANGKFLLNTQNIGFGIDIGATYEIGQRIQVSAAVTDIGFINWKDRVTNLNTKGHFEFNGLNITDLINDTKTLEDLGKEMWDSVKNSFVFTKSNTPFKTYLPARITLGGSINVTKNLSLGILAQGIFTGKQYHQAATLSANLNLWNALSTSLSYTAANSRYDNLGAGIAFRLGVVQLYFIADRIPLMWNKIIFESGKVDTPANWNMINIRFGLNLVFGNHVKTKSDKPMLLTQPD
jgi:hypothetical protein